MKRAIWAALLIAAIAALAVGSRDRELGPRTVAQRTEHIAEEVRCPTCEGLSVAESTTPASESIRSVIAEQLEDGATDEEVRAYLVARYGRDILLRPPSRGLGSLVWIAPVVAFAAASAALLLTFHRRRTQPAAVSIEPTAPDLVSDPPESRAPDPAFRASQRELRAGPGSGRRVVAGAVAGVLLLGGVAGGVLTSSSGEREVDAPATGDIPRGTAARLARARQLIGEAKVLEAIRTYDAVLADHPDEPEALAYRGWMVRLAGKQARDHSLIDRGLESIERAVEVDPSYPDARFFRGMVLWEDKGDPDAAVREFEAFLTSDPPVDMVDIVRGALERAKGDAAAKAAAASATATPSTTALR